MDIRKFFQKKKPNSTNGGAKPSGGRANKNINEEQPTTPGTDVASDDDDSPHHASNKRSLNQKESPAAVTSSSNKSATAGATKDAPTTASVNTYPIGTKVEKVYIHSVFICLECIFRPNNVLCVSFTRRYKIVISRSRENSRPSDLCD